MKLFKTFSQKPAEIERSWFIVDASEMPLGRLATVIADALMGKSKTTFTPHVDNGDYVVVVNAKNLVVTGTKETKKMYYRHSGYQGGLKELTLKQVREKNPGLAITEAVKGMLPKNKLQADRLARLRVFAGSEHDHTAQMPKPLLEKGAK
jgi:large subunit ribosomal protein L13